MPDGQEQRLANRSRAIAIRVTAGVAVAVGACGLAGWLTGIDALKSVSPAWVAMKANTAIGFLLAGGALWLAAPPATRKRLTASHAAALAVALLGALTFLEYAAGVDLGIDQLLFREAPKAISTASPGRMAFISTTSFFLFGGGLLLHDAKKPAWASQLLAVAVVATSLTAFLGYLYGTEMRVGGSYAHMALHTTVAFLALGTGLLAASSDPGATALATSPRASGALVRTLTPALLLIVLGFSAARVYGERVGLFGAEVGASVLTVASMLSVCLAVWIAARSLDRAERERDKAQAELDEREKTRAEELEREVATRTSELAAANRELEAFSYSVSHDLRSPLRSILGFSVALEEDCAAQLDDGGRSHLKRIRASAERMNELIDDLLELSRVHRSELACVDVDVTDLAESVIEALRARDAHRTVDVQIAPGLRATADARLLRVALENVLGNAWKFTSKRASARIEVGILAAENALFVRDNGAGFDMAYAAKLFAPFQRMHSPTQFEGTGIGLATVQRVIHRHGGRVWAESSVDVGTTLFLAIPSLRAGG